MKKSFNLILIALLLTTISYATNFRQFNSNTSNPAVIRNQHNKALHFLHFVDLEHPNLLFNAKQFRSSGTDNTKSVKNTIKQCLDSMIIENEKEEYLYDNEGNLLQETTYYWEPAVHRWEVRSKIEYTYDDNNNNLLVTLFERDAMFSTWKAYYKYENTYNENNNKIREVQFIWDNTIKRWIAYSKTEYSYNESNNLSTETSSAWDEIYSSWETAYKNDYSYDENNNMLQRNNYRWDSSLSQWIEANKFECSYDENGNELDRIYYKWDTASGRWLLNNKYEYTYNDDNNNIKVVSFNWDSSLNLWEAERKYEYDYNTNGIMVRFLEYNWDPTLSRWKVYWKIEYDYNTEYTIDEIIQPDWILELLSRFNTNAMLSEYSTFEWYDYCNCWELKGHVKFHYSPHNIVSTQSKQFGKIEVYPNPALSSVYINLNGEKSAIFELFGLSGQRILQLRIIDNKQLNIENLKSGVYLYSISYDDIKHNGKLIKK